MRVGNLCPKGHEMSWISFGSIDEKGGVHKYGNLVTPHALLYCKTCGVSYNKGLLIRKKNSKHEEVIYSDKGWDDLLKKI